MNIKLTSAFWVLAFSGVLASANASNFSYTYIEGAYENIDFDGPEADVFRVSGSYDVAPYLNIIAEYATGDLDNPLGGSGLDFDEGVIGVGYHTGIAPGTDFTANIKAVNQDLDVLGDDTGYGVGIGVRHLFANYIEGDANIDFVDVNNNEDTALTLGARYHFNSAISAGLAYRTSSDDVDVISGNLRWSF